MSYWRINGMFSMIKARTTMGEGSNCEEIPDPMSDYIYMRVRQRHKGNRKEKMWRGQENEQGTS